MTQLEQYLLMLDESKTHYWKKIGDDTTDVLISGNLASESRFTFDNKTGKLIEVEVEVDGSEVDWREED